MVPSSGSSSSSFGSRRLMCISGSSAEAQAFMEVEERDETPTDIPFFEVPFQCFLTACPLLFHNLDTLLQHFQRHQEFTEIMNMAGQQGSNSTGGDESLSPLSPLSPWLSPETSGLGVDPYWSAASFGEEEVWSPSELEDGMRTTESSGTPLGLHQLDSSVEEESVHHDQSVIKCEAVEELSDYSNCGDEQMGEYCDENLVLPDISANDLREPSRPWGPTCFNFTPRKEDPELLKQITLGYILKSSPRVPAFAQPKEKAGKARVGRKGRRAAAQDSGNSKNKKAGRGKGKKACRKILPKDAETSALNQSSSSLALSDVTMEEEKEVFVSQPPSVPVMVQLLDQDQRPVNVFEVNAIISSQEDSTSAGKQDQVPLRTIVNLAPFTITSSQNSSVCSVEEDPCATHTQVQFAFSQNSQEDNRVTPKAKKPRKPSTPKREHWTFKHVVQKAERKYLPRKDAPHELELRLICPIPGCEAHYRNPNGLKYHATHFHKDYKFF